MSATVFGKKLRQLRQARGWTQAEIGTRIGVHQKQISSYERGSSHPTTEALIRLAEVLEVSLDFLALGRNGSVGPGQIKDTELLEYFAAIDEFPEDQKAAAKQVLDLLVLRSRVRELSAAR